MKKGILILALIFILFPVFCESSLSEKQKEAVIKEVTKNAVAENRVFFDSYKGNFTGSGNDEFLMFLGIIYNEPKIKPLILKTIVAVFSDEELVSIFDVPYRTSLDKGSYESGNLGLGMSQGWINDFNGNGLDELLFTESGGSYMVWDIFEYHDGKFIKTFGPDTTLTMKDFNLQKKELSVIHHLYSDARGGYYEDVEERYIWDPETNSYVEESELKR